MWAKHKQHGFTIVELLIVIVVIGILAAITIVAYNGIQSRALVATIQSDLTNARTQIGLSYTDTGAYPLDTSSLKASPGTTYSIVTNNIAPASYCLQATNGSSTYSISNNSTATVGGCTITSGLVGWWKFDGDATDSSGGGNNGTVNGASLTTGADGRTNGAYSFNGANSIATPGVNLTGSPFTITFWVKANSLVSSGASLIGDATGTTTTDGNLHLGIRNTRPWMGFYGDDYGSATTINTGQWYFMSYVLTATPQKLVYINAVLDGSTTGTNFYVGHASLIGTNCCDASLIGSMDDVRVYNRALSVSELQATYNAGAK